MEAVQKEYIVPNALGIHARVAARLISTLSEFDAKVFVSKDGDDAVHAGSILDWIAMGAEKGAKLLITIEGNDAAALETSLDTLFATNMGDED
ncbi:MAG: HPr family phosphocarrier protein [Lentisphaeria bacterium]|nr:HPr family phosphocarrier protein [Lentisphaeria bacterium]NQZ69397.1 HPr family phosphocarrier protein [Lentisphaeria bacterium]